MPVDLKKARLVGDRVWKLRGDGGYMFRCQKKIHSDTRAIRQRLEDVESARADHDVQFHRSEASTSSVQSVRKRRTIEAAFDAQLPVFRELNPGTLQHYTDLRNALLKYKPFVNREISTITKDEVDGYIDFRLHSDGSKTQGGCVLKELYFLERLARASRIITLDWSVKVDYEKRLKRLISSNREKFPYIENAAVQVFLDNLNGKAYVFALMKWLTGARSAELANLRVEDVHLDAGEEAYIEFFPRRKNVVDPVKDWRHLGSRHLKVFQAYARGKKPGDLFFPNDNGEPVTKASFRKPFAAASEVAEIYHLDAHGRTTDVAWEGIKWMRHNRSTRLATAGDGGFAAAERRAAEKMAAESIGASLKVFVTHYRIDLLNARGVAWGAEIEQKKRDAALMERTVTSDPKLATVVRGIESRTANILITLTKSSKAMAPVQIAQKNGAKTEVEIQSYRTLLAVLSREGRIARVGRGMYQALA